jgi:GNAT superfamily N-acetyltransferase
MDLHFREAVTADIPHLVQLLSDDELGSLREDNSIPINQNYLNAFHNIEQDANNELTVVEAGGEIVGMLQLTFIPYLTHIGSWRCLIEGVRVNSKYRDQGLGTDILNWAIDRAKIKHCSIVQLTSDKQRPGALNFYENLGFKATHEGFKLKLKKS